ncbi:hypothetical protein [Acidovorax carolinensis]|uniref:hypothetical protein n=1 Tax=Acidovorax carolinensis TaxID=553814 RepID=UPI001F20EF13|nr:hypothetical protein [Acidovorax carolinensis]
MSDGPDKGHPGAGPSHSEPPAFAAPKATTGRPAELPGSFTRVAFSYPGAPQDHYYLYVPRVPTPARPCRWC